MVSWFVKGAPYSYHYHMRKKHTRWIIRLEKVDYSDGSATIPHIETENENASMPLCRYRDLDANRRAVVRAR